MPPRNIFPVDRPRMPAMTTIGIDGGMMMPMVEEIAVTATVNSFEYFFFTICGMSMPLTPAVSAAAEPEMPANTIDASTFHVGEAAVDVPHQRVAEVDQALGDAALAHDSPAKVYSGMASSAKEFIPSNMRCPTVPGRSAHEQDAEIDEGPSATVMGAQDQERREGRQQKRDHPGTSFYPHAPRPRPPSGA